jgi:hypothetical protein
MGGEFIPPFFHVYTLLCLLLILPFTILNLLNINPNRGEFEMKTIFIILSLLSLVACSSRKPKFEKPTGTGEMITGTVNIIRNTPYQNIKRIPKNVTEQCTKIGDKVSRFTQEFGTKMNVKFKRAKKISKKAKGNNLVIEIIDAVSSGNAFIGHRKSITIEAYLYKNGKLVDNISRTRNTSGGFAAGFKSSCDVLGRSAKTLGSDIATWVKRYTETKKM